MKQKFHKWFWVWEYEKEQKWLNDMAAKGFGLCHVGPCTYWFDDCEPHEYTYYLEFAEHHPSSAAGQEYLSFLSECGVDYIGNYMRWIYLRRKNTGEIAERFELHTDLDSKIAHLRRIILLILPALLLNLYYFGWNLFLVISRHMDLSIMVSFISLTVSSLLGYAAFRIGTQIHKLKKERQLHE